MNGEIPVTYCSQPHLNNEKQVGQTYRFVLALLMSASTCLGGGAAAIAADPAPSPAVGTTSQAKTNQTAVATVLRPDSAPLNLTHFQPGRLPDGAISATTISATGLTLPSLWWIRDQYAAQEESGERLIDNWIAYPSRSDRPGRVDFVVNRQFWSLFDYLQRYSFIHEFGTAASGYGYNIRVFDSRGNFLAAYTCDFTPYLSQLAGWQTAQVSPAPTDINAPLFSPYLAPEVPLTCKASLDFGGKSGLDGRTTHGVEVFPR